MIKAVIFDIDGVLLESKKANTRFFQILLKGVVNRNFSKKELDEIFHLSMWDAIKLLTKEKSKAKIRKLWELGHETRYPVELLKIAKHSKKVIRELSQVYKLAIVTNRIKKGVRMFYKVSKMRKCFDVAVSFEDYSKPKPSPEPLLVAAKKLKIKPEEAIYIGDSELDMKAAKAADMKFIFFSKKCLKGADFCIDSFEKLPSAIARLQKN